MPVNAWLIPLLVLVLTQGIVVAVLIWRTRALARRLKDLQTRRHEPVGDVPTSMLVTVLSQLDRRMGRIEASLKRQPAPAPVASGGGDRSYDLAQRLARQGASAEQITEACGIGLQEAELLLRLHAPR